MIGAKKQSWYPNPKRDKTGDDGKVMVGHAPRMNWAAWGGIAKGAWVGGIEGKGGVSLAGTPLGYRAEMNKEQGRWELIVGGCFPSANGNWGRSIQSIVS